MKKLVGIFALVAVFALFLLAGLYGSFIMANNYQSGREYLEAQGFELEETLCKVSGTKVYLRYPQFVEKAYEYDVTTVYITFEPDDLGRVGKGRDWDFWFYANGNRYEVWEKYYVPKDGES